MSGLPKNDETFGQSEDASRWREVLARITPNRALNLDEITAKHDPNTAKKFGRVLFPKIDGCLIGNNLISERPAIGVLVDAFQNDSAALAARLASLAIERDCEIIIMSDGAVSGLERFGFRTERIGGETGEEREACLEQLKRFWNIEIVI